jgi:hypothetical protein
MIVVVQQTFDRCGRCIGRAGGFSHASPGLGKERTKENEVNMIRIWRGKEKGNSMDGV